MKSSPWILGGVVLLDIFFFGLCLKSVKDEKKMDRLWLPTTQNRYLGGPQVGLIPIPNHLIWGGIELSFAHKFLWAHLATSCKCRIFFFL